MSQAGWVWQPDNYHYRHLFDSTHATLRDALALLRAAPATQDRTELDGAELLGTIIYERVYDEHGKLVDIKDSFVRAAPAPQQDISTDEARGILTGLIDAAQGRTRSLEDIDRQRGAAPAPPAPTEETRG